MAKLTYENVVALLELTEKELALFNNFKTLGLTPAKARDEILKQRKEKEKQAKRERKNEDIAKKATEKQAQARELVKKLQNLPDFKDYSTPLVTIKNISRYNNFRGKTWQVFGKIEIQNEVYAVTLEYSKDGLFDNPCFINVEDIYLEYGVCTILDYEKDVCLPMEYEEI